MDCEIRIHCCGHNRCSHTSETSQVLPIPATGIWKYPAACTHARIYSIRAWREAPNFNRAASHGSLSLSWSLCLDLIDGDGDQTEEPILGLTVAWALILVIGATMQLAWIPVLNFYEERTYLWPDEMELGSEIASFYKGGSIAVPENRPSLIYVLARYHNVSADSFQSQMYDPFFYMDGDPFANWEQSRGVIADWLSKLDIRLLVFPDRKQNYQEMVQREPTWFKYVASPYGGKLIVYEVVQPALR